MTYERAIAILNTSRESVTALPVLKAKAAKCSARLAKQKLTASYGKERVSGGKQTNSIEDAVIKAEQEQKEYEKQINAREEAIRVATAIVNALPKNLWTTARCYYIKGMGVTQICRKRHWTSRTSCYKQLDRIDAALHKLCKE